MSVTFKDNSKEVFAAMERAKSATLIKVGTAAKHNIQDVIVEKDVYDTGELHRTIDWGADGIVGKIPKDAVDVGSPRTYAPYQELGTIYISPRPFIRPGILDNMDEYKEIAGQTIGAEMK